jgi:HEAT repeat protein/energy-coupling factor transporter ATP-binding protein EcfA2
MLGPMATREEILITVENALKQTEGDNSLLESWRQSEDGQKVIQYIQIGKYNTIIGEGTNITIGDQWDRSVLEEIRDLLLPSQPLDINWQEVSRRLLEEKLQITTSPMTSSEDIVYKVEQVFVPLGLVERKKIPRRKRDVLPEKGSELYQEDGDEGFDTDMVEEIEVTQRFEHEEFLEQVIRQQKSPKSQGNRIAIIGEPGAGKTTLLQQIARWICTEFPESIVIWISLADLQGNTLENYLKQGWLQSIIREAGGVESSIADKKNFSDQFKQSRVWLMLDGLDEMQSPGNSLSEIQRQIQEGGWLRQARLILTCRLNLWDGNYNTLAGFDAYRTLNFSYPSQVEQFIQQWFEPRRKKDLGMTLCSALKEPGRERIRDLVKNPLRLTLLCFSWYLQQGKLPETQAELYQRSIDRFYEWKQQQFPTTSIQREALNQALAELSRQAIDDADDRQQTRFRLRHDFVRHHLDKPLLEGQKTLLNLALEIGWLNQVGVDADDPEQRVYAFFHPTFEEYFAALSISDEKFFFNPVSKNPIAEQAIYRIFEPQWKQVFLLWLGRKDEMLKPKKDVLIKSLMTFRDRCGGFYSDRAFLLASVGISEFKDCSYSNQIIHQLILRKIRKSEVFASTDLQRSIKLMERILEPSSNDITPDKIVRAMRQRKLDVAERLGEIDPGNNIAIRVIKRVLEPTDSKDFYVKSAKERAIRSLSRIATNDEDAVQTIVEIMTTDHDKFIQQTAAESLREVGAGNEIAIQALVWLLESTHDESIAATKPWNTGENILSNHVHNMRCGAIESLGKIGFNSTSAIEALVQVLETAQDENTLWKASDSLSEIGIGNASTIRALIRIFETTQDEDIRWLAINNFIKVSIGNEISISELMRVIETNENQAIRMIAFEALGKIAIENEAVKWSLLQILEVTQDEFITCGAAYCLGKIDHGNEVALRTLEELLRTTKTGYIYLTTAYSLGKIDPRNRLAIQSLVQFLETAQNESTYLMAAQYLASIDPGNKTAIQALVQLLETIQDESIYLKAARLLASIEPSNNVGALALLRIVKTNKSWKDNYKIASNSLGRVGVGNKTVILELIRMLDSPKNLRLWDKAMNNLGTIAVGDEIAVQALLKMVKTQRSHFVRRTAMSNLRKIDISNEVTTLSLVKFLRHRSLRISEFYQLMQQCSEVNSYKNFYQAFHSSSWLSWIHRTLNFINLTINLWGY